ncbi:alpha/beta hydrolase [Streptomyces cirratus]|nr:alpha/beta fold hydrolase [Streptomyces cirratus]
MPAPADRALIPLSTGAAHHRAKAAVLLLHGGRVNALGPPSRLNLPALRMRPFASAVMRATVHDEVLVARVRYQHRGWNGHHAHPVADARRALDQLRTITGPVPIVLIGHSLGGRAALRLAADPEVGGVIALAPWCPPGEPTAHLRDRTVIALHDEADTVTSAADTWAYVTRAHADGARVAGIRMPGGRHSMIGSARLWHRITAETAAALLGLASFPDVSTPSRTWNGQPHRP